MLRGILLRWRSLGPRTLGLLSLVALGVCFARASSTEYLPLTFSCWVLAIVAMAMRIDLVRPRETVPRDESVWQPPRWIPELVLFVGAAVVLSWQLTDIPYFIHNDEANCGLAAHAYYPKREVLLWARDPIMGHPAMPFFFHSLAFRVFGEGLFALRFVSVCAGMVAVTGLYCWLRWSVGRLPAILVAGLGATHIHLIHFSHSGLSNIQAAAVIMASLAIAEAGFRFRRRSLLFLAGAVSCLGFFGYWSGNAAFPLILGRAVLEALWRRREIGGARWAVSAASWIVAGYAFTVAPALTVYSPMGVSNRPGNVFAFSPENANHVRSVIGTNDFGALVLYQLKMSFGILYRFGCSMEQFGYRGKGFYPHYTWVLALLGFLLMLHRRPWRKLALHWSAAFFGGILVFSALALDPPPSTRLILLAPLWMVPIGMLAAAIVQARSKFLRPLAALMVVVVAVVNLHEYFVVYTKQTRPGHLQDTIVRLLVQYPSVMRVDSEPELGPANLGYEAFRWLTPVFWNHFVHGEQGSGDVLILRRRGGTPPPGDVLASGKIDRPQVLPADWWVVRGPAEVRGTASSEAK